MIKKGLNKLFKRSTSALDKDKVEVSVSVNGVVKVWRKLKTWFKGK